MPTLTRLDGRAFHTLLKKCEKPFDKNFVTAMEATAVALLKSFNADIAYWQSDEITLAWSRLDIFDLRVQKLCSTIASYGTVYFYKRWGNTDTEPTFNCRIWQVPTLNDAAQNLLWRELDATKNSVSMVAHSVFKQKELNKVSTKERIAMLEAKGIIWSNYEDRFKRGSFFKKKSVFRNLTEEELLALPEKHRHLHTDPVERSTISRCNWPRLTTIANLTDIFFNEDFMPVIESGEEE